MQKKTILLFGGTGLIGTRVKELLLNKYSIIAPSHREVDLAKDDEVRKYLDSTTCDLVVYAAGITNQDVAEKEREYAMKINNVAAALISKRSAKRSVPVVYFSSDAVFQGDKSTSPYNEGDKINPVNYYGITKARGEDSVLSTSNKNLVLRLVSVYSGIFQKKVDFARRAVANLKKGEEYYGIKDQYFNPTFSDDAMRVLDSAIQKNVSGILHVGSKDYMTNYDFIYKLAEVFKFDKSLVVSKTFSEFFKNVSVRRGQYVWLDTSKTQRLLGENVLHTSAENLLTFTYQQDVG